MSFLSAGLNCDKSKFKLVLVLSFLLMMCFPLVMVNTPGSSINEKNRQASGGLFLFPFSWAHLPFTDQTTVTLIYLGPVGGSLCEITPDDD
jgi:hypothetical protein